MLAGLLGGLSYFHATAARGDARSTGRWSYDAPSECPSLGELERALRASVPARSLEGDPRRFVIRISREREGFLGRLTFFDDVGERVVVERSCQETVQALVLFIAIALDPGDTSSAPTSSAPTASPPPPLAEAARPAAARRRRQPPTLGLAAGMGITSGPVPGPAPVFTIAGVLHQPLTPTYGAALRLGMVASVGEEDLGPGRLDALLVAAKVELTPTIVWRSLSFAVGPAFTFGGLSATTEEVILARRSKAFWADVGAIARAGLSVGLLRFELYAGAAASLTPRTYLLQRPVGERAVYTTPPLQLTAGGELVVQLGR